MKYLKKFNNHTLYEEAGQNLILPNVSLCQQENEVHYNPIPDYSKEYLTFVAKEDGTFQLSINAVSYSLDNGETWTTLAADTASPTVTAGNKIMWKGELTPSKYYPQGIGTFSATGNFDAQGNPMSLLYGDSFKAQTDLTGKDSAFFRLYYQNTKLVNTENLSLPATTLAESCYDCMFQNCTSLITTPKLSATTLTKHCYADMFYGCESLTTAPVLPATTLASSCYSGMFWGCTSLTTVPELPATTLVSSCYEYMFKSCTNLTIAPELPATTLATQCYGDMFQGCTSLTAAPELPAITLSERCYQNMFQSCTSLITAPILPANTLVFRCYANMFNGCSKLNHIKAMFTTTPSGSDPNYYTINWVKGISATGTFVKNSVATWNVTGNNGIPSGWTVETASE